jgi:hypothetical protein
MIHGKSVLCEELPDPEFEAGQPTEGANFGLATGTPSGTLETKEWMQWRSSAVYLLN